MTPADKSGCAGFTLVEVLTALALMSILGILAYRGLDAVLATRAHLSTETAKWRKLAEFFERFEHDLQLALERPVRGGGAELAALSGERLQSGAARLEFSRAGLAHETPPRRVGYGYDAGRRSIVLSVWPALDHDRGAGPEQHEVLRGVASFELEYLHRDRGWRAAWDGRGEGTSLPHAVRARVVLDSGEAVVRVIAVRA